jgi:hypothetical protein
MTSGICGGPAGQSEDRQVPELLHAPPVNQPFLIAGLVRGRTPASISQKRACNPGGFTSAAVCRAGYVRAPSSGAGYVTLTARGIERSFVTLEMPPAGEMQSPPVFADRGALPM